LIANRHGDRASVPVRVQTRTLTDHVLEILDPGGDLTRGFTPNTNTTPSLMLMVSEAIEGKSGVEIAPFRDYRGVPVVGAEARTIEEWREHIVAGRGIGLCPASAEAFSARPGTVFVPARGVPPTTLNVARRADDLRPAVLDDLGADIPPGPGLYEALLTRIAGSLRSCLTP